MGKGIHTARIFFLQVILVSEIDIWFLLAFDAGF